MLKLYYHPLSSYCQKVLVALYENGTHFTPELVDLGNAEQRSAFLKVWPMGKFPVLVDEAQDRMVPESSIIIEYLDQHFPGPTRFIPADGDTARQMRMRDRFFDLYIMTPMQKIIVDRLRPEGTSDAYGVAEARRQMTTALDLVERDMSEKTFAMGDAFSMADCAAAPALFYANMVAPFGASHANVARYLERLKARPSVARVFAEATPYLSMVPK